MTPPTTRTARVRASFLSALLLLLATEGRPQEPEGNPVPLPPPQEEPATDEDSWLGAEPPSVPPPHRLRSAGERLEWIGYLPPSDTRAARNIDSVAASSNGRWVAIGSSDKTVRILVADTAEEHRVLPALEGAIHALGFSANGSRLAAGSTEGELRIWDPATGRETLAKKTLAIASLAWSRDGNWIALGGLNGRGKIVDVKDGSDTLDRTCHKGQVRSVAFSWDGRRVVTGGPDGRVRLWDRETGEDVFLMEGHQGHVQAVATGPDLRALVSGGMDGTIRIWDASTGVERNQNLAAHGAVMDLEYSAQGSWIAGAWKGGWLGLARPQTGEALDSIELESPPEDLAVCSNRIWVGCEDGAVRIYRVH